MRPGEEAHWIAVVFVRCAGDDVPQVRRKDRVGKFSCKHLTARLAEVKNRRPRYHGNSPDSVLRYAPPSLASFVCTSGVNSDVFAALSTISLIHNQIDFTRVFHADIQKFSITLKVTPLMADGF